MSKNSLLLKVITSALVFVLCVYVSACGLKLPERPNSKPKLEQQESESNLDSEGDSVGSLRSEVSKPEQVVTQQAVDLRQEAKKDYQTGLKLLKGEGVQKDETKAYQLIHKSAEQGYPLAQHQLGLMHVMGNGVEKNMFTAAHWFEEAAKQGLAISQFIMATLHERGEGGLEKDLNKACQWVFKAAQQGIVRAQYSTGVCAENGLGMEKNIDKAKFWYEQAALQGFEPAKIRLAQLEKPVASGDAVAQAKAVKAEPKAPASDSEKWIKAQDPVRFTLQVSTQSERARAFRFIEQFSLQGQAVVFASQGKKGVIHSVIHGSFVSRKDAEAAIALLPEAVRKARPWVRQFKYIQRDMLKDQ